MAVHDRVFVPILALAVLVEGVLIFLFHARVGQIVLDVLIALVGLLVLLSIRCYVLLPTLHAESLAEPELTVASSVEPARTAPVREPGKN
jgi:hypothetical protein